MTGSGSIFVVILLASWSGACTGVPDTRQKNLQRMDSLEIKLKEAIRQKIKVCDMGNFIGMAPVINTCSDQDRMALLHANITADSDTKSPGFPKLSETLDVVYWKLSDEPDYTRVKGIYWEKSGEAKIFSARIYPP